MSGRAVSWRWFAAVLPETERRQAWRGSYSTSAERSCFCRAQPTAETANVSAQEFPNSLRNGSEPSSDRRPAPDDPTVSPSRKNEKPSAYRPARPQEHAILFHDVARSEVRHDPLHLVFKLGVIARRRSRGHHRKHPVFGRLRAVSDQAFLCMGEPAVDMVWFLVVILPRPWPFEHSA